MPGRTVAAMRACIASTMRAAWRIVAISAGLLTARCQFTSPVASRKRALGSQRCNAAKAAALHQ